jgi:integrase
LIPSLQPPAEKENDHRTHRECRRLGKGRVARDKTGKLSFTYNEEWRNAPDAFPLSISMPLALSEHGNAKIDPLPLERWNLLRKHLKPAANTLGLPGVTWHLLRHSHATMLDSVGTPLGTMQSLLGHSTPEITREIYLHAVPEEQRRAVESVERLVFGPKWTQVQAPTQTAPTRWN